MAYSGGTAAGSKPDAIFLTNLSGSSDGHLTLMNYTERYNLKKQAG
jgi:hypothetical protein